MARKKMKYTVTARFYEDSDWDLSDTGFFDDPSEFCSFGHCESEELTKAQAAKAVRAAAREGAFEIEIEPVDFQTRAGRRYKKRGIVCERTMKSTRTRRWEGPMSCWYDPGYGNPIRKRMSLTALLKRLEARRKKGKK